MRSIIQYIKEEQDYSLRSKISKSNVSKYISKDGMDANVQSWYHKEYETDSMWKYISKSVTFADILKDLVNKDGDVYTAIFGDDENSDSTIRERIFERIATLCECDYDDIYYLWLAQSDK